MSDLDYNDLTRDQLQKITNQKLRQTIYENYEVYKQLAINKQNEVSEEMTSAELIKGMLLPGEQKGQKHSIFAKRVEKVDLATNHVIENRFGVNIDITSERVILSDVNVDKIPFIHEEENYPQNNPIQSKRVGYQIRESLYFQPIPFKNIQSLVVDVYNQTEASIAAQLVRNRLLMYIFMIVGVLIVFFSFAGGEEEFLLFGLISVVIGLILSSLKAVKLLDNSSRKLYSKYRSVRIRLIDPETLKPSIWKIVVDNNFPVTALVNWASELQDHIKGHLDELVPTSPNYHEVNVNNAQANVMLKNR